MILRSTEIHLTAPICDCREQKLAWAPIPGESTYGISVSCKTCKTKIIVPSWKIAIRCDTPYPADQATQEPDPQDEGNVIPFART